MKFIFALHGQCMFLAWGILCPVAICFMVAGKMKLIGTSFDWILFRGSLNRKQYIFKVLNEDKKNNVHHHHGGEVLAGSRVGEEDPDALCVKNESDS